MYYITGINPESLSNLLIFLKIILFTTYNKTINLQTVQYLNVICF